MIVVQFEVLCPQLSGATEANHKNMNQNSLCPGLRTSQIWSKVEVTEPWR